MQELNKSIDDFELVSGDLYLGYDAYTSTYKLSDGVNNVYLSIKSLEDLQIMITECKRRDGEKNGQQ